MTKKRIIYGHTCEGRAVVLGSKEMSDEDVQLLWEACMAVYAGNDQGYITFDHGVFDIDAYAGITVEDAKEPAKIGDI